ncbi:hypothetical protein, partial [Methylocapsa palsarum]
MLILGKPKDQGSAGEPLFTPQGQIVRKNGKKKAPAPQKTGQGAQCFYFLLFDLLHRNTITLHRLIHINNSIFLFLFTLRPQRSREIVNFLFQSPYFSLKVADAPLISLDQQTNPSVDECRHGRLPVDQRGRNRTYDTDDGAQSAGAKGSPDISIACPSSDDLRQFQVIRNGGSGSSTLKVKRPAVG